MSFSTKAHYIWPLVSSEISLEGLSTLNTLESSDAWNSLTAVKNQQAYVVRSEAVWTAIAWTPEGRNMILQELEAAVQ